MNKQNQEDASIPLCDPSPGASPESGIDKAEIRDSEGRKLILQTDDQGDFYLNIGSVFEEGLRFCTVVGGGSKHIRTRNALRYLMTAMQADALEHGPVFGCSEQHGSFSQIPPTKNPRPKPPQEGPSE